MIEFIMKRAPSMGTLFCFTIGLAALFFFNWFMSDMMGEAVVKYSDECIVGEYNTVTHTGSLTCGEYEKYDGSKAITGFVGKVYINNQSVFCEITENEYSGNIEWDCNTGGSENTDNDS